MTLGHLGVAVTVIGIVFSHNYSLERDVRMTLGDSAEIHGYHFRLSALHDLDGPNYGGTAAQFDVTRHARLQARMQAEKRIYGASRIVATEAAVSGGLTRDLYVALGERLDDGSWAIKLYYKPFVRWIWFGGLLMAAGGLCCLADPRYRAQKRWPRATGVS
jgi:cytochrome c-type biogenesis protein CcmF